MMYMRSPRVLAGGSLFGAFLIGLFTTSAGLHAQTVTISGSTLALTGPDQLAGATALTFDPGGVLQYAAAGLPDYSSLIANSTGAIDIDTDGQNVTFNSAFQSGNTGGLTKDGAGTLLLNADNEGLLSGTITINAGTLKLGSATALDDLTSGIVVNTGGTLDLNGALNAYTGNSPDVYLKDGGLSGGGTVTNSSATSSNLHIWTGSGWTTTFSGGFQNGATSNLTVFLGQGGITGATASTLNLTGISNVDALRVENGMVANITGTMTANDGSIAVTVGENNSAAGSVSTLNVNGGLLSAPNGILIQGWNGTGTTNVTNGGTLIANKIWNFGGGRTEYINVNSGGTLYSAEINGMADSAAGDSILLTVDGGTLANYVLSGNVWCTVDPSVQTQIGNNGLTVNTEGGLLNLEGPITDAPGQTGSLTLLGGTTANYGPGQSWNNVYISGSNTYSGGTTISYTGPGNRMNVQLQSNTALGSGPLALNGNTMIDLHDSDVTVGALSGTGGLIINYGSAVGTLNVDSAANSTYAGQIWDDHGTNKTAFVKSGAGTLTLTGNNNNTGGTTVNGGTLQIATNDSLAPQGPLVVNTGGTLDLYSNGAGGGFVSWLDDTISGGGTITNTNPSTSAYADFLIAGTGWTSTFSGSFMNGPWSNFDFDFRASAATFNLTGTSVVDSFNVGNTSNASTVNILTGANVTAGVFVSARDGAANLVVNGGLLQALYWARVGWGTAGGGSITLTSGTIVTPTMDSEGGSSGAPCFLNLNGGVLETSDIRSTGAAAQPFTLTMNGGDILVTNNGTIFDNGGSAHEMTVQFGAGGGSIDTNGFNTQSLRSISDVSGQSGALTKLGLGTLTLTTPNSYSGGTTVAAGTLALTGAGTIGSGPVTLTGGALNLGGDNITNILSLQGGTLQNGTVTQASGNFDIQSGTEASTATFTGAAGLAKTTSGIATLLANNSYSGGTTVAAGTLALTGAGTIGSGPVTLTGGALDLGGDNITNILSLQGGTLQNGTVTQASGNFDIQSGVEASTATLAGAAGLTKTTPGTAILSGNNTYTGATTINGGILQMGADFSVNNSQFVVNSGGTWDLNNHWVYWVGGLTGDGLVTSSNGNNGTLGMRGNDITQTFGGTLNNIGVDFRETNSTWNLTGSSNISGGGLNIGNVDAADASTINITGTIIAGFVCPGRDGAGTMIVDGGLLQLADPNWGSLRVGWGAPGDPDGSGTFILQSGTVVAPIVDSDMPVATSSPESFQLNGGTLYTKQVLIDSGSNAAFVFTMNGGKVVVTAAGTLFQDGGSSNGAEVNVQIGAGGGFINTNGFNTSSVRPIGDVTGQQGPLTKSGAGTLTLTAANTYSGPTTIEQGTLALGAAGSINNSPQIDVQSGAIFDVSAVSGFTVGATQTLMGAGTVNGSTTVAGTIQPHDALATTGVLNIDGALTLDGSSQFVLNIGTGGVSDQIDATGAVTLGAGSADRIALVISLIAQPAQGDSFTLLQGASLVQNGLFTDGIDGVTLSDGAYFPVTDNGFTGDFRIHYGSNSVTVSVVPEPANCAMLIGGLGALLVGRRMRRRRV